MSTKVLPRTTPVDEPRHTPGWADVFARHEGISQMFPLPDADEPRRAEPEPAVLVDVPRCDVRLTGREVAAALEQFDGAPKAQMPFIAVGLVADEVKKLLAEFPTDRRVRRAVAAVLAFDLIDQGDVEARQVLPAAGSDAALMCSPVAYRGVPLAVAR